MIASNSETNWVRGPRSAVRAVLLAVLFGGCAGSPSPGTLAIEGCLLGPARTPVSRASEAGDTVRVALSDPVDPARAPVPSNPSERLVFAQLYQTLVAFDCTGRVEPGAAESWISENGGRTWTFTLRPDLRSWRGDPLSARDLASSWIEAQAGWGGAPASDAPALRSLASVSAPGARTFRVEVANPVGIEFFANPELSVRSGRDAAGWPIGTGLLRPRPGPPQPGGGPLTEVALEGTGDRGGAGAPAVVFRSFAGDPRDALDAGADALVTTDPATIAYARSGPGHSVIPLPWDRAYALLTTTARPLDSPAGAPRVIHPPATALEALAVEAVRQEARAAALLESDRCELRPSPVPPRAPATPSAVGPRIVFPAGDPVARALAERIVALSSAPAPANDEWLRELLPRIAAGAAPLRTAGLSDGAFADALASGRDVAFIVPVEDPHAESRDSTDPTGTCSALLRIGAAAPWTTTLPEEPSNGVPGVAFLVETRSTLLIGREISGTELAPEGIVRFGRVHRRGR